MTLSVDHIHHLDRHLLGASDVNRPMALWVPSERITVHVIEAPAAPQRKWPELIPWLLEDRILQPVEEMHFVIGASSVLEDKKQLTVSVVSKQDLREWLRIADNAGVDCRAMVADYLALPFEPGRISMAWREGQFLVRTASDSGFAAEADLAWLLVHRHLDAADIAPRLSVSVPDESLIPDDLRADADINNADIDWQFAPIPESANLLAGDFKPLSGDLSPRAWLSSAALLMLALVLCFGYLQLSNGHLEERIGSLESVAETSFGNVFLGSRAKPEAIRSSGERLLADLFKQRESIEAPLMRALTGLDALMSNCDCELQTLVADSAGVSLTLKNAAKVKARTVNVPGFTIERQDVDELTSITLRKVAK